MVTLGLAGTGWTVSADQAQSSTAILRDQDEGQAPAERADGARRRQMPSEVLGWNQIFIDTLIATNTANSSSPRLGAIVHTAIFDAYNGIEHRYTPIFVRQNAPDGASRRASVIAAAYTTLAGLFPSRQAALDASYSASLAALSGDCDHSAQSRRRHHSCATPIERGVAWGTEVAQAVLAWRATDGFSASYPPFNGGTAVGQWRPTPPAFGPMSAQALAFTAMFVLVNNTQFEPGPPRSLTSATYTDDFNAVEALGRQTGSTPTGDQAALALFWDGNASVHWNQAANQIARANHLSTSDANRLLAVLNIAMADTAFTTWSGKRFYGGVPTAVTWRPVTAIPLADTDRNPDTAPDPGLAATHHHAVTSGIPGRASQPQWRGCDRAPQPIRTTSDVHADDHRPPGLCVGAVCSAGRLRASCAASGVSDLRADGDLILQSDLAFGVTRAWPSARPVI
jgi:hypothetical protein